MTATTAIRPLYLILTAVLGTAAPMAGAVDLTIGSAAGTPDNTVNVPIRLGNDGTVSAMQLDLHFDDTQLTIGKALSGSALTAGYRVASSGQFTPGVWRIVVIPPVDNTPIASGAVISVPVTINPGAGNASKLLTADQVVLSSRDALPVAPGSVLGGLIADATNTTADTDADGLPDVYEIAQGFNPLDPRDASQDADNDGLTNLQEYALGTNPHLADTDGDGMPDGWEVAFGLNPLNPADAALDTDGDGVSNLNEYLAGSNPTVVPTLDTVTGVAAYGGIGRVTMTWHPVPTATRYNIYWNTTPGVTKTTGTPIRGLVDLTYAHPNLTNGTPYYYIVTAVNSTGESPASAEVSATPSVAPFLPILDLLTDD
jgi:hypothetical protein